jgi:hypothetical protein
MDLLLLLALPLNESELVELLDACHANHQADACAELAVAYSWAGRDADALLTRACGLGHLDSCVMGHDWQVGCQEGRLVDACLAGAEAASKEVDQWWFHRLACDIDATLDVCGPLHEQGWMDHVSVTACEQGARDDEVGPDYVVVNPYWRDWAIWRPDQPLLPLPTSAQRKYVIEAGADILWVRADDAILGFDTSSGELVEERPHATDVTTDGRATLFLESDQVLVRSDEGEFTLPRPHNLREARFIGDHVAMLQSYDATDWVNWYPSSGEVSAGLLNGEALSERNHQVLSDGAILLHAQGRLSVLDSDLGVGMAVGMPDDATLTAGRLLVASGDQGCVQVGEPRIPSLPAAELFLSGTARALLPSDQPVDVLIKEDGKPVPGAMFWSEQTGETFTSDLRGMVRQVPASGMAYAWSKTGLETIVLHANDDGLEVELGPSQYRDITLVDADGTPVEGAQVATCGQSMMPPQQRTDREGRARVFFRRGSYLKDRYLGSVWAPEDRGDWLWKGPDGETRRVSAENARNVTLKLLDREGLPLPNEVITLGGCATATTGPDGIAQLYVSQGRHSFESSVDCMPRAVDMRGDGATVIQCPPAMRLHGFDNDDAALVTSASHHRPGLRLIQDIEHTPGEFAHLWTRDGPHRIQYQPLDTSSPQINLDVSTLPVPTDGVRYLVVDDFGAPVSGRLNGQQASVVRRPDANNYTEQIMTVDLDANGAVWVPPEPKGLLLDLGYLAPFPLDPSAPTVVVQNRCDASGAWPGFEVEDFHGESVVVRIRDHKLGVALGDLVAAVNGAPLDHATLVAALSSGNKATLTLSTETGGQRKVRLKARPTCGVTAAMRKAYSGAKDTDLLGQWFFIGDLPRPWHYSPSAIMRPDSGLGLLIDEAAIYFDGREHPYEVSARIGARWLLRTKSDGEWEDMSVMCTSRTECTFNGWEAVRSN